MKNKGFTLIELLGSIVILAIIATVAFPAILNFLSSSQSEIDNAKKSVIERAAKDYVNDNVNYYKRDSSFNDKNVEIKTNILIEQGYITNKDIIDNKELANSCVAVKVNQDTQKYTFTFKEKNCS